MNNINFFIGQEINKVETRVRSATAALDRAKTIRDVVRESHVSVPATVSCLKHTIRGFSQLDHAAAKRIESIVEKFTGELDATSDFGEARKMQERFFGDELPFLRGRFSREHRNAERQILEIMRRKELGAKENPPRP